MVKAESDVYESDAAVRASKSQQKVSRCVVLGVRILPHLRHLGDRFARSPTSKPDLTPYSGEVMSS